MEINQSIKQQNNVVQGKIHLIKKIGLSRFAVSKLDLMPVGILEMSDGNTVTGSLHLFLEWQLYCLVIEDTYFRNHTNSNIVRDHIKDHLNSGK